MTIADYIKSSLPSFYITEDTDNILSDFIDAIAVPMEYVKTDITNLLQFIDYKTCPEEFLPIFAESIGMEYPSALADIDLALVRRLLGISYDIYKSKGSEALITYLALEIVEEIPTIVEPQDHLFRTWSPEQVDISYLCNTERTANTHTMLVGYNAERTIYVLFPPDSNVERVLIFQQIAQNYTSVGVKLEAKPDTVMVG